MSNQTNDELSEDVPELGGRNEKTVHIRANGRQNTARRILVTPKNRRRFRARREEVLIGR
jgi:hypothetical protein